MKYPKVAYFCMEYGLDSDFKQYAGGLGILAGDYLKGAKEGNYPIIGIGILWKQGYTDQYINNNGVVFNSYQNYKYDFLEDTGITVSVTIRKRVVTCKVWKTEKFNNVPLYLFDTDVIENSGEDRWITGELYGWFGEERIAQEMVLGIGGIKLLRELKIQASIYHFNEGHALFAGFELIKEKMDNGDTFENALEKSKKEIVFTTHTPIIEGNEAHDIERIMYMGANNGLTVEQLVYLGGAPFNMTVAGLKMSKISNAVAQLHCKVSNNMWKHIKNRSQIIGITNAIHLKTWVDNKMIENSDNQDELWEAHTLNKKALVDFISERNHVELDVNKLIIGFSRRAALYKRSDFIFTNESIIKPLLDTNQIQIVFSGKSHPLDDKGKNLVEKTYNYTKKYPKSVVFLENYDMEIGKILTRGADVWLNNPRRPKEASGTSGMKAAMNGVLNLSILDGWWPEICNHGVNGWQFGDGFESESDKELDKNDLTKLYSVLINEVIPLYYNNKPAWIKMMSNSINDTKDYFATERMLKEYFEKLYMYKAK